MLFDSLDDAAQKRINDGIQSFKEKYSTIIDKYHTENPITKETKDAYEEAELEILTERHRLMTEEWRLAVRKRTQQATDEPEEFLKKVRAYAGTIMRHDFISFRDGHLFLADTVGDEKDCEKINMEYPLSKDGAEKYIRRRFSNCSMDYIARKAGVEEKLWEIAARRAAEMFPMSKALVNYPETFFSPKSKVANMMFANEFSSGEVAPVVTIKKPGKFGVLVSYNYHDIETSPFIRIGNGSKLSEWERTVHDAVSTLMETGNTDFDSEQILRVAHQDPGANMTDTEAVEIAEAMMSLNRRETTIITDADVRPELWDTAGVGVLKPERQKYQNVGKLYYGRLLDFRAEGDINVKVRRKDGNKEMTMTVVPTQWHMLARPLLYDYSAAKGQISSTPMKALYTAKSKGRKLNRGRSTDGIVNFLSRQIDTMKTNKNFSRFILWDTLYELDGLDNVKEDDGSIRKKKNVTRRKVCKILDEFKDNGLIEGYTNVEKQRGKTKYLHSVEICLLEKTVTRSGKNGNA